MSFRRYLPRPAVLLSWLLLVLLLALLINGVAAFEYEWRWQRLTKYFFRQREGEWIAGALTRGLQVTLQLSLLAGALAIVIGLFTALARLSVIPSLRALAWGYVQFMRATPLLVQLYLLYFMFSNVFHLERFAAGTLSLALFEAAFAAEIFRAGYLAVAQGQIDAAQTLGLTRLQYWRFIVIPQALPLVLPPLANLFVSLIKHSSIVTVIAMMELTDTARNLAAETFLTFEIWLCIGALYIMLCFPLAQLIGLWERRLRRREIK